MKSLCLALFTLVCSSLACGQSITITTDEWQPYINKPEQALGSAAELLKQLYSMDDTEIRWQYQHYDLAYYQVAKKQKLASFPYFKTDVRASQVLFSKAIFYATSYIYFNRQFQSNIHLEQLNQYKIGRVSGYSYGEKIDGLLAKAQTFVSEKQALEALLNHQIDYLPMTESVMNNLLNNEFSTQKLLIKPLDNIKDNASLHLIAANNSEGQQLITALNAHIDKVAHLASMKLVPEALKKSPDLAKLVVAEGYPAILGQTLAAVEPQFYTLPQGTSVLVIKWSNKMLTSSTTDTLYKNMMAFSHVLILNGPLVGEELLVRNMHIELL